MQTSKAAEVPEELFKQILWHAYECGREAAFLSPQTKRPLSACSTVCRYWARMARRQLFRHMVLASLDDVKRLCAILDAPVLPGLEHVKELLEHLCAKTSNNGPPWHHLVFLTVLPKLQKGMHLQVTIRGSSRETWRTLNPSLPRALPGSIMPVHYLHIDHAHFPDGRALARLLLSVPQLEELETRKVVFNVQPTYADFLSPPFGLKLSTICSDDLSLCLALIPRLLGNAPQDGVRLKVERTARMILEEGDLATLDALFGLFRATPAVFRLSYRHGRILPAGPLVTFLRLSMLVNDTQGLREKAAPYVAPPIIAVLEPAPPGLRRLGIEETEAQERPAVMYVRMVYIDLVEEALSHLAFELCDEQLWTRLAETAVRFRHLRAVEVTSSTRAEVRKWAYTLRLTNAAFHALIKDDKFRYHLLDVSANPAAPRTSARVETTIPALAQKYSLDDLPKETHGTFSRIVMPRVLQELGRFRPFSEPCPTGLHRMMCSMAAYESLRVNDVVAVRLAKGRIRDWQSGFGTAAIQCMALAVDHVTTTMRDRGMTDDAIRAALSGYIQKQLGPSSEHSACSCRRFWWWYHDGGHAKRSFGGPLVLYAFSHHIIAAGGTQILRQERRGPWRGPAQGALVLSVLAAQRALQAYSTGTFEEPPSFSASSWRDGWHYLGKSAHTSRMPTAHLDKVVPQLTIHEWHHLVHRALAVRGYVDITMASPKGKQREDPAKDLMGTLWDGILGVPDDPLLSASPVAESVKVGRIVPRAVTADESREPSSGGSSQTCGFVFF
ncbi:hypothetical protein PsYK624_152650 [Phanerochaete sordida]|uniref:F-box domain-containing protein n=1 Tax=Phanerochaete sordida TaxID=48140 RepID=A0A9P3LM61_9APHY|nr:hypothetical protein PsYK624_152650 [Phanerochaete sordida]